ELRLYALDRPKEAVVIADLHSIRNRDDLASLLAHFDRRALLPETTTDAEMNTALDPTHPQHPIPSKEGCYRIVFRFLHTQSARAPLPLFKVERALREAFDRVSDCDVLGARRGK